MSQPLPQDLYRVNGYHSAPPFELPSQRGIPPIHIVLFLLTLVTTSLAGAFQQGANPFEDPGTIVLGLPFSVTLMSILLFHEMGHYLLARRHGVHASLPYF